MKKVLSISLGSSNRDHRVQTTILNEDFFIERRGTNGNQKMAAHLFKKYDGQYDAFGLGGIDLYIYAGNRRYTFRDARKLIKRVEKTPVVDGSGLKNTLERKVIESLKQEMGLVLEDKKVLMVSALDRFGMAEAFNEKGSEMIFGDIIFGLKLPIPVYSIKTMEIVARIAAPVVTKLPFELIYPTGNKQDKSIHNKFNKYYQWADIIAGDFHYIRSYMPDRLENKIIITNTVTSQNIEDLKQRGIKQLITTTPEYNNRSFGTNVMEAILVALAEKRPGELTNEDYRELLNKMKFKPRVINF